MPYLKNIPPLLLFLLIISFSQSCSSTTFGQHADSLFLVDENVTIRYDLKKPSKKYLMPYVLEEISGLTYSKPNSVLAVDDESGKVFQYHLSKEKIIHSIDFHKPGDYEGVELIGNQLIVIESDGDLFSFDFGTQKKVNSKKYENDLTSKNDTEGLGYDPSTNQLLVACKEEGEIDSKKVKGRAFYQIDFTTMQLGSKPAFVIGPTELEEFWEEHRNFDYEKKRINFKPSAIATHPISGHYYILSSVGKMLLVTNKMGGILASYPISPRILGQPEGLCFSPSGDMFISSEGEGDRGYILKFKIKES